MIIKKYLIDIGKSTHCLKYLFFAYFLINFLYNFKFIVNL